MGIRSFAPSGLRGSMRRISSCASGALVPKATSPYLFVMRVPIILAALLAALAPCSAIAQVRSAAKPVAPVHTAAPAAKPAGPKAIGKFEEWTAATSLEGGQSVCYAFTRAQSSAPTLPGRGDVVLTVTERPAGRDAVALSAGFAYAANAKVELTVEQVSLDFYTAQRSAFARDGHAAVMAFLKSKQIAATSPGPKSGAVTDQFSLKGFNAAYAAISKACPPK